MCIYCGAKFHALCQDVGADKSCCCKSNSAPTSLSELKNVEAPCPPDNEVDKGREGSVTVNGEELKRRKPVEELRNPKATGRKEARKVKDLDTEAICEWAGLRWAGGGTVPVVGCQGNKVSSIHHGPDKNTLNNSMENLHAICSQCHSRWHGLNDRFYPADVPGKTWLPTEGTVYKHDPHTKADAQAIVKSALYFSTSKNTRRPETYLRQNKAPDCVLVQEIEVEIEGDQCGDEGN